jgi:protoheme IX farnesyltransferase
VITESSGNEEEKCDSRANGLALYLELTKPRILSMILITTTLGFFLGGHGIHPIPLFLLTLTGVGSAAGGSAMLNNYLERHADAKMNRTRGRVLPTGLVEPVHALVGGVGLVLFGVLLLVWAANLLTGFLVLMAAFLYVLVYTPLKRVTWLNTTWLNTTFGAIPGAIPPMAGWVAATGRIDLGAWVLFAILFAWQHPHFFAIAWMFRCDYRAAGFKMLPVVEPSGKRTFQQTVGFSVLLIGVSLLPTAIGMAGWFYFYGALLIGLGLLVLAVDFTRKHRLINARRLLGGSILYLPLLLLLIILDAR